MILGTQADHDGPAWLLIPWGLFATVLGTALATNFRGFADRFIADGWARAEWLWRFLPEPSEASRTFRQGAQRFVGAVFAVIGPISLIVGVVLTIKHPPSVALPRLHPRFDAVDLAVATVMTGIVIVNITRVRADRNPIARAWRRSLVGRVGTVIVAVGVVMLIIGFGFWMQPPFIAGWAVGAFGAILMIAADLSRTAENKADPAPQADDGSQLGSSTTGPI